MKKFSNISGSKVYTEPKLDNKDGDIDVIKYSIMNLMDQILRIESNGSARRNILPSLKIAGKEMFVEALMDIISEKSFKDQIKVLDSLRSKNRDWESIDEGISSITTNINNIKDIKFMKNDIKKIKDLIDIHGSDSDNFNFILERQCNKVKDSEVAQKRANAALLMIHNPKYSSYSKERLEAISNKFIEKSISIKNDNDTKY